MWSSLHRLVRLMIFKSIRTLGQIENSSRSVALVHFKVVQIRVVKLLLSTYYYYSDNMMVLLLSIFRCNQGAYYCYRKCPTKNHIYKFYLPTLLSSTCIFFVLIMHCSDRDTCLHSPVLGRPQQMCFVTSISTVTMALVRTWRVYGTKCLFTWTDVLNIALSLILGHTFSPKTKFNHLGGPIDLEQ